MKKTYTGQTGTTIKLITSKIEKELDRTKKNRTRKKRKNINSYKFGKLSVSDLENVGIGIDLFERMLRYEFDQQEIKLISGEEDISKIRKDVVGYRNIIENIVRRISLLAREEFEITSRVESLSEKYEIAQAARDGILLKKETRAENVDGKEKIVEYDTSMSVNEILQILDEYERELVKIKYKKLDNYMGLGLGLAGTIGAIFKSNRNEENKEIKVGNRNLMTLGTMFIGTLKLLEDKNKNDEREEFHKLREKEFRIARGTIQNEQISKNAKMINIETVRSLAKQELKIDNRIQNKRYAYYFGIDLAIAIFSGLYVNKMIEINDDGKIDGKSLARALVSLQANKSIAGKFVNSIQGIIEGRKDEEEFENLRKKVKDIYNQMDEKVYPLKGAQKPFDSIKISNFVGKFYPKKDYETGEVEYSSIIKVPEFSMKRGDVILLSGESGTGKSTFLRFLKRGDINNRNAIQIDDNEMVDSLGDEYISFRPSINLGDETNVLYQITGKESISDLTDEERENIISILNQLEFNSPNLIEDLAKKKFMEFSTGQQRRLALSKVFYRIDDGTSVIIVDEPVGNVQDSLIRDQLEMIKNYAKEKNIMLILTTHRLDLAEDLATKRYNINKDGVLEEEKIKMNEDKSIDEI